ncbi:uncharacterized protein LOC131329003 isoform X2 [Rhododendron vialii]|uniref:uncharacterized protein LOC131329003 isoform X2 n=1 Tax=Rhododendron vialii TaxID=182163 RepID=UPI00265EA0CD|nr:uncharacterized protein LOC131329003 isoform X2 [Rhododendron vialii]
MASTSNIGIDERDRELYKALIDEDKERVLKLCKQFEEGPFHVVTIHNDTVLHVATYSKQAHLVLQLLETVSDDQLDKLTFQNKIGNTILHEASTSDGLVEAAKKMLIKAPGLLYKRNQYDVTPLYRSVCYGKIEMFKFLHNEIQKRKHIIGGDVEADSEDHFQQKNKTTILHTAVVIESFDLALLIAKKYEYLINKKDKDEMTALQLLACNSSAFESKGGGWAKRLICSIAGYWGVPLRQEKWKQNQRYESALTLAKFLIKKDTSWIATKAVEDWNQTKYHTYGGVDPSSFSPEQKIKNNQKQATTPLFLATKFGCVEIVKEILSEYPWAVEYIDHDGCTILHRAIKYREMQILEIVAQMGVPMRRLVRKVDRYNNTILHMDGEKTDDPVVPVVQSPAFQLQDNLLLFERVREICPDYLLNTINMDKKTAQQLFDAENQDLREKAKEWLKRTAENSSLVAILIATVAFAAAYTIPGGPNQSTGLPILLNQPFFVVFTMTDVLSLTFALTSVIIFLRILTSPFRLNDFKQSLPQILMLGLTFPILSVSMMMFAFAATVILMIRHRGQWTKVALYTASFLPVTIFALSYLPLYLSLMKTVNYSLKKVVMIFPRCTGASVLSCAKSFLPKRSRPNQIETPLSTCPPKSQACPNLVEIV